MNKSKVHIIAEAGSNHNGSFRRAEELIIGAKEAGADSIKFQIINTWGLYLPGVYEYGNYDIKRVINYRKKCELSDEEYMRILKKCKSFNINLSASIFDSKGLNTLLKLNPPYVKIASGDLNNYKLLDEIAEHKIKIILSTGMSTLKEIENTINRINKRGNNNIVIMHCVSIYPCDNYLTNLNFIDKLKFNFDNEIGFSDHTKGTEAASIAISKGAKWIEKHFTVNRNLKGLDHKHSLECQELKKYINTLREIEFSLKEKEIKLNEKEIYTKKRARRSLYASRNINPGEIIKDKDVLIVRPESFISADKYDQIIGKKCKTFIGINEPFKENHFE